MQASFSPVERFDLLRVLDRERPWYSLEEKRVCTVCDRIFSGDEIKITISPVSAGYLLQCPTPGCRSDFSHWLLWRAPSVQVAPEPFDGMKSEFSFL